VLCESARCAHVVDAYVCILGRLFAPGPGTYKIPALDDIPRVLNVHLMKARGECVCAF
jgi:xanthine dehydrogenase molybdopterin-binding subunit B